MKMGARRYAKHALGSCSNGIQKPHRHPRLAITWSYEMLGRLNDEATLLDLPVAEIVRRRIKASYEVQT